DAKVALHGGEIETLHALDLELDAQYANDRAKGELLSRALGSGLKGSFDLPVAGLRKGTHEAVSLDLAIEPTTLPELCRALGIDLKLSGRAAATLKVEGTAAVPRLRLTVKGDEVRFREAPPGNLGLVVESDPDGQLMARVDLDTMGARSYLLLKTPLT